MATRGQVYQLPAVHHHVFPRRADLAVPDEQDWQEVASYRWIYHLRSGVRCIRFRTRQ